ncbi:hypothetical protein K457DRAFT_134541 [Linnemannia elongata AG-77]|uniref:DinB-like domain-containing protein n=1 Tax=Linnemannia elongata AG-77 TaxID=1314771 RepID=A0A197K9Q9_9FUNG|nr:hypothetical protein K457DRAFT_134541 [Linnemannia elongata AG-77]
MATTSGVHIQESTPTASSNDDSRHIYTVAAKSLQDCVELLQSLKAAMAVEAQEAQQAQEQEQQRLQRQTNGNGNGTHKNGGDSSTPAGKSMRDIHHMSRSASQEAEQDPDSSSTTETSPALSKPPRAASSLPQAITPCPRSEMYTKPSVLACQGTIGKHVRHLHDHYRLLLATFPPVQGLSQEHQWSVDYDKRSREVPMESDIDYAIEELESLQFRLERHVASINLDSSQKQQHGTTATTATTSGQDIPMPNDLLQPVTLSATIDPTKGPVTFQSTFGRELWFCSLHAVHHFAMIKVICAEFGMPLTEGFGVAPSTLKSRMAHH